MAQIRVRSTKQAAAAFRRLAENYRRAILEAEEQNAKDALKIAVEQTSGTISAKMLRRMGHPYALRAPQTPVDAGKSNDQGGGLPQSWQIVPPQIIGGRVETHVVNRHPDARWLKRSTLPGWGGKMVPRPIEAAVLLRLKPIRTKRLRAARADFIRTFKEQLQRHG